MVGKCLKSSTVHFYVSWLTSFGFVILKVILKSLDVFQYQLIQVPPKYIYFIAFPKKVVDGFTVRFAELT